MHVGWNKMSRWTILRVTDLYMDAGPLSIREEHSPPPTSSSFSDLENQVLNPGPRVPQTLHIFPLLPASFLLLPWWDKSGVHLIKSLDSPNTADTDWPGLRTTAVHKNMEMGEAEEEYCVMCLVWDKKNDQITENDMYNIIVSQVELIGFQYKTWEHKYMFWCVFHMLCIYADIFPKVSALFPPQLATSWVWATGTSRTFWSMSRLLNWCTSI